MKIIVSHDVDHLYPSDHIFRDLIFPRLWLRSTIEMIHGEIGYKTFIERLISLFSNRLNRIPEIIEYDRDQGVNSTFFFGMDNILGLSYRREKAAPWIKYVLERGFEVGVHGIDFENLEKMKQEYDSFRSISGEQNFGIRTHFVRYNENTFSKMEEIGYIYDTSEFNKTSEYPKFPYKIDAMWEFPLHIMDVYILKEGLETAKKNTIKLCSKAESIDLCYLTFLFHDVYFNNRTYPAYKEYYQWFIDYCIDHGYEFLSYTMALKELKLQDDKE